MKLPIKNMVCPRCVEAVDQIFSEMNLPVTNVELGLVEIDATLTEDKKKLLREKLSSRGFELIVDRKTELINLVKSTVISYIEHLENSNNPKKLSDYISEKTNYNYSYLSKVFSDNRSKTIEGLFIELKIERVKELLQFRKWTLSEIAWKLKYSSVQYLSNQFKKITGQTVTEYLEAQNTSRKSFDSI